MNGVDSSIKPKRDNAWNPLSALRSSRLVPALEAAGVFAWIYFGSYLADLLNKNEDKIIEELNPAPLEEIVLRGAMDFGEGILAFPGAVFGCGGGKVIDEYVNLSESWLKVNNSDPYYIGKDEDIKDNITAYAEGIDGSLKFEGWGVAQGASKATSFRWDFLRWNEKTGKYEQFNEGLALSKTTDPFTRYYAVLNGAEDGNKYALRCSAVDRDGNIDDVNEWRIMVRLAELSLKHDANTSADTLHLWLQSDDDSGDFLHVSYDPTSNGGKETLYDKNGKVKKEKTLEGSVLDLGSGKLALLFYGNGTASVSDKFNLNKEGMNITQVVPYPFPDEKEMLKVVRNGVIEAGFVANASEMADYMFNGFNSEPMGVVPSRVVMNISDKHPYKSDIEKYFKFLDDENLCSFVNNKDDLLDEIKSDPTVLGINILMVYLSDPDRDTTSWRGPKDDGSYDVYPGAGASTSAYECEALFIGKGDNVPKLSAFRNNSEGLIPLTCLTDRTAYIPDDPFTRLERLIITYAMKNRGYGSNQDQFNIPPNNAMEAKRLLEEEWRRQESEQLVPSIISHRPDEGLLTSEHYGLTHYSKLDSDKFVEASKSLTKKSQPFTKVA
ncbi:hypothetical protein COT48_03540 [Candidatus Woesearchaeota archaeon CG08_land_8_20_14_0_20_47_9]|nr:MAG: hypothetical protein COT48_03540 [Candidatus Woesearchaeota archaeon CG08_land_8_20_14_0_20_47_9]